MVMLQLKRCAAVMTTPERKRSLMEREAQVLRLLGGGKSYSELEVFSYFLLGRSLWVDGRCFLQLQPPDASLGDMGRGWECC